MGIPGLRERKKAQTHEAIVDAALDLFEKQGFEKTTIEEIADAAGVSPRTFFRYFDSKDALIIEHDEDEDGAVQEFLLGLIVARPAEESPVDAIYHVVRDMLVPKLSAEPKQRVRAFRVAMETPSLRRLMAEHIREHQVPMVRSFALRLGTSEDDLAPRVMAAAVCETLFTVMEQWVADDGDPDKLPVLMDEAFGLLRSGFTRR